MPVLQSQKIREQRSRTNRLPANESTEWVGLWSVSLGIVATVFAAIVYFAGRDNTGALFILAGTAGLVALMMRVSTPPQN